MSNGRGTLRQSYLFGHLSMYEDINSCTIQQDQAVHTFLTPSTMPTRQRHLIAREYTNIIDLKFVKSHQHNDSSKSQSPMKDNIRLWIMSFWNIIRDHGIKSNM